MKMECTGLVKGENDHFLRWGFRWWYCSKNAKDIRSELGEPLGNETAVWAQYQRWSKGLLVAGLPTAMSDIQAGKSKVLANIFLKGAPKNDHGTARWNMVQADSPDLQACKANCNVVWYINGFDQGAAGCAVKHPPEDFLKNRAFCSLCLP